MKVVKSLNNNMVLVEDYPGKTRICQGKGIGYQKRPGDMIDETLVERSFIATTEGESSHFQQMFSEIPGEFWKLAEDVAEYGEREQHLHFSQKVILPLCDHLAGSVKRYQQGIILDNPMLWDIKRIYPKEFQTGLYALKLVKDQFGLEMKEDEAAFLAYHFVNAQLDSKGQNPSANEITKLIGTLIDIVQKSFDVSLDAEERNYQNFLAFLKFLAIQIMYRDVDEGEADQELYDELSERYPDARRCVDQMKDYVIEKYQYEISQEDCIDLMIHIERMKKRFRRG